MMYNFKGYSMKIILLRLKMFFGQKEVKRFILTFTISFPLILMLMFYFIKNIDHLSAGKSEKLFMKEFEAVIRMPKSTNYTTIVEKQNFSIKIRESVSDFETNNNFWSSDALNYRYTVPQKGLPED